MEIRDKIISGSSKMFIKFGIRSITMDMIAEQLGISKRTIYENFTDKNELLKYSLEAGMVEQKAVVEEIFKNSENVLWVRNLKYLQNDDLFRLTSWAASSS